MLRTNAFSFIEIMFEILIGKINIKISILCFFVLDLDLDLNSK